MTSKTIVSSKIFDSWAWLKLTINSPALTIIVSIVMFVIGSSITLSLGLLGALSIIRFRTPIKNTSDMVYIFWAIATGLSIGAQNHIITISSVIFLSLVITFFNKNN